MEKGRTSFFLGRGYFCGFFKSELWVLIILNDCKNGTHHVLSTYMCPLAISRVLILCKMLIKKSHLHLRLAAAFSFRKVTAQRAASPSHKSRLWAFRELLDEKTGVWISRSLNIQKVMLTCRTCFSSYILLSFFKIHVDFGKLINKKRKSMKIFTALLLEMQLLPSVITEAAVS